MLNILVTGSNGQLGSELKEISSSFPLYNFIFTDVKELDITDPESVGSFLRENETDAVINCAAFTAVDLAEDHEAAAMLLNKDAVINLGRACNEHNAHMVHISTDYVFDGLGKRPYSENDPTGPKTAYGRSKLAGEEALLSFLQKGMIIRTSWLYSSFGSNFVKTILKFGKEKGELRVVNDQVGRPTYARDLANVILEILPKVVSMQKSEVYHYSNEGSCSWFDLATASLEMAGINCIVNPVSTKEYPQKAKRPAYSILDVSKIKAEFGIKIPHWKDSLGVCIGNMSVERRA